MDEPPIALALNKNVLKFQKNIFLITILQYQQCNVDIYYRSIKHMSYLINILTESNFIFISLTKSGKYFCLSQSCKEILNTERFLQEY